MRTKADRIKAFRNIARNSIPDGMYWRMLQDDYFEAPASANHHGNFPGGLYDHSEMVALVLASMTERMGLKWDRPESPYIIGFLHDYCKVDQYTQNEQGEYVYNGETLLRGHGDKYAILLLKEMRLTDEELICIRYHMGAYEGSEMWNNLGTAIKKYPNVLWTHTADMYASHILGF